MLKAFKRSPVRGIAKASETERWSQVLLDAAPDAMVVVDQDGRIVLVNAQTEKLFEYQREEILGLDVESANPGAPPPAASPPPKGFLCPAACPSDGSGTGIVGRAQRRKRVSS